jgi:hypothetical protein
MFGKESILRRWASKLVGLLMTTTLFSSCFKHRHATWNTPDDYYALPRWSERVNSFMNITRPPLTADLFIGDSITEGFDLNYFFGDSTMVNMGILKRLEPVARIQPKRIFLLIGINDVLKRLSPAGISSRQQEIILALKKICPQSNIYVQSLLPINSDYDVLEGNKRIKTEDVLAEIQAINTTLEATCQSTGVNFIHLYPAFTDRRGQLLSDLTYDGLHLNNNGNQVWTTLLRPLLQ